MPDGRNISVGTFSTSWSPGPSPDRESGDSLAWPHRWILEPAASQDQVWGSMSTSHHATLASERPSRPNHIQGREEPWPSSLLMVGIICFYCYILYRFQRVLISFFKNAGGTKNILSLMNGQSTDFAIFLRSGIFLSLFCGVAIVISWLELQLPELQDSFLWGIVLTAFLSIVVYRWIILELIRFNSGDRSIERELRFINRVDYTIMSLFFTPLAVIVAVSGKWFVLGVSVVACMILYHFWTVYKYFRMREFSSLRLILYLCTVEILPVSFWIALAVRNNGLN